MAKANGSAAAAPKVSAAGGAAGAEEGDGFVVAPRVQGKNAKRPVRDNGVCRE